MMKKLIAVFLAFITVLGLPSCNLKGKEKSTDPQESIDQAQTETSAILVSDLANYRIVYANGVSMETFKKIRELQSLVEEKFSVRLESSTDDKAEQEKEILIGATNRPAGAAVFANAPKADDYAIGISEKKIVVAAHTDDTIRLALDAFLNALSEMSDNSQIFFKADMCKSVTGNYDMDTILLDEHDVADYTVVCDGSDAGLILAKRIQSTIRSKCGYLLRVSKTVVDGKMILVGKTDKGSPAGMSQTTKDYYFVGLEGSDLYLYGEEFPAAYKAVEAFCELVSSASGKTAVLNVLEWTSTVYSEDTSMTAMSFNLLYDTSDPVRVQNVIATIKKHMPDTFGVQEETVEWMELLDNALGDEYSYVGDGRDPSGSNEFNAVFYRKDKFELLDFGTKWMSDTPDVVGSKVSGSVYPRTFTYAVLKVKATGDEFIHVNTHTDHVDQGDQVRLKQVQVIVDFLKTNYPDLPTIVTGDMNETINKPSLSYLKVSGFDNSAEIAVVGDNAPTFRERVIDFLFVSDKDFFVYQYDVDTDLYDGEYASDHRAIIMRYQFLN